ncbi:LysM peptidoglycan-binding domain-containing protein [Thiotrichales bacterium 19X7-9]|nr:LysM peptidoglycan-binding domain-containing protein [Thiotrichales bacterium 19X7-9]
MGLNWLLRGVILLLTGLLTACASMTNFFDAPRQGGAAEVTSLGQMPKYYTVKQGDTLPSISRAYGISERAIILWNNLQSPYRVEVGQKLQFFAPESMKASQDNTHNIDNDSDTANLNDDQIAQNQFNDNQDALIQPDTPVVKTQTKSDDNINTQVNNSNKIPPKKEDKVTVAKSIENEKPQPVVNANNNVEKETLQSDYYTVKRGDTLLGIARDFNLNLNQIAMINQIKPPYDIFVGEKLLVNPDLYHVNKTVSNQPKPQVNNELAATTLKPLDSNTQKVAKKEEIKKEPVKAVTVKNTSTETTKIDLSGETSHDESIKNVASNSIDYAGINWQLPLKGKVSDQDNIWLIDGKVDDPIRSVAKGKVIYSGVGINGYGKMVIVDHGNQYLSAYGNLASIDVKEGQSINQGQVVGQLGKFKGDTQLDFEIRYQGNLISPNKIFKAS